MSNLVILLFACYTVDKYKRQIEVINETWGKQCEAYRVKIFYFLGEEKRDGFQDTECIKYVNLKGVGNDYLSASYKQFLGLKYIYENCNPKFIYCAGTDTYVNVPKLVRYVRQFSHHDCLYLGGDGDMRQIGHRNWYYHSGGAGFIITYPCLEKLYDDLPTLMDEWTTLCTTHQVPGLIPACDVSISYYLQQPKIQATVIKHDVYFSNSNYQGWPWRPNQVDSTRVICCHFMNEKNFGEYTQLLQKHNYYLHTWG